MHASATLSSIVQPPTFCCGMRRTLFSMYIARNHYRMGWRIWFGKEVLHGNMPDRVYGGHQAYLYPPPTAAQAPIVSLKLNNKLNSGATTYIDSVNSIEWTPAAAVFPAFDRGLYFDGSTDNGVLSNNTLKLFHSFTMEAWVRVTHSRVIR
jgi:hypothetical protein